MQALAESVKTARTSRGLSQGQLAARMRKLQIPWTRQIVTNFENQGRKNGKRKAITFEELNALALVLDIPPIILLFPIVENGRISVLPDRELDARTAAAWFSGEERFPMTEKEFTERYGHGDIDPDTGRAAWYTDPYEMGAAPMILVRKHRQLLTKWRELNSDKTQFTEREKAIEREKMRIEMQGILTEMKRLGMNPPPASS